MEKLIEYWTVRILNGRWNLLRKDLDCLCAEREPSCIIIIIIIIIFLVWSYHLVDGNYILQRS